MIWEVIKMCGPAGTVRLPSTWLHEVLGPGKSTKHGPNRVCAFEEHILKSRYIVCKARLVKAMVFPVVMYACKSWTVKKAEC